MRHEMSAGNGAGNVAHKVESDSTPGRLLGHFVSQIGPCAVFSSLARACSPAETGLNTGAMGIGNVNKYQHFSAFFSRSARWPCRVPRLALDRARASRTAAMPPAAALAGYAQGLAGLAVTATRWAPQSTRCRERTAEGHSCKKCTTVAGGRRIGLLHHEALQWIRVNQGMAAFQRYCN